MLTNIHKLAATLDQSWEAHVDYIFPASEETLDRFADMLLEKQKDKTLSGFEELVLGFALTGFAETLVRMHRKKGEGQ